MAADSATASADTMSTGNPAVDRVDDKTSKVKPEKPDEEKYKVDLAKAEKDHAAVQESLVSLLPMQALREPACSLEFIYSDHAPASYKCDLCRRALY